MSWALWIEFILGWRRGRAWEGQWGAVVWAGERALSVGESWMGMRAAWQGERWRLGTPCPRRAVPFH